jgi:hypothetical protein
MEPDAHAVADGYRRSEQSWTELLLSVLGSGLLGSVGLPEAQLFELNQFQTEQW